MYSSILRARVLDRRPVSAVDPLRISKLVTQALERALVRAHRTAGRRDHDGAFAKDHIAGKERSFRGFVQRDVFEGVAGRIDHAQCEIAHMQLVVECKRSIVRHIGVRMHPHDRTGSFFQRSGSRCVIGVAVRDRNGGDP